MSNEPDNLVLELLRGIRANVAGVDGKVASLDAKLVAAKAELKADIHSLRADVASDLATMRKETSDQIVGLRRAAVEYHSAVLRRGF